MKSVVYIGLRGKDGRVKVYIDGTKDEKGNYHELHPPGASNPSQERRFDWGHSGPGAYLLSLSLLTHFLEDEKVAAQAAAHFLESTVSKFRPGEFVLNDWQIEEILGGISGNGSHQERSLQNDK